MRISAQFGTFLTAIIGLAVCMTVIASGTYARPRPQVTFMTVSDSIAACDEIKRSSKNQINCIFTDIQGHPTLAVEFANERSMKAYLGTFSEQVADPFCDAANKEDAQAFFVVALKNPRIGSVSWCETGESGGWVSLTDL